MKYEITESVRLVNFTAAQIKWASGHSWFVSGTSMGIVVRDEVYAGFPVKLQSCTERTITGFQYLRDWAGY
jgi:hypothetical protein